MIDCVWGIRSVQCDWVGVGLLVYLLTDLSRRCVRCSADRDSEEEWVMVD